MNPDPKPSTAPAPAAPVARPAPAPAPPAQDDARAATRPLGPYVDEDGSVTPPEPSGKPISGIIPMDAEDVPEAFL